MCSYIHVSVQVWQYEAQAQSLPVVCLAVINTSGWQRCEVVPLPREGERGEVVGVKKKPTPRLTQAMHDGTEIGMDVSYSILQYSCGCVL